MQRANHESYTDRSKPSATPGAEAVSIGMIVPHTVSGLEGSDVDSAVCERTANMAAKGLRLQ